MIIFILTLAFAFSKGSLSLNPRISIFKIHLSSKWLYKCSHRSPKSDLIWYQSCRHCRQGVNVTEKKNSLCFLRANFWVCVFTVLVLHTLFNSDSELTSYLHSYNKFSSCNYLALLDPFFCNLSFCLLHNSPIMFSYQKSKRTELSIIWEKGNLWNRVESSQSHILL